MLFTIYFTFSHILNSARSPSRFCCYSRSTLHIHDVIVTTSTTQLACAIPKSLWTPLMITGCAWCITYYLSDWTAFSGYMSWCHAGPASPHRERLYRARSCSGRYTRHLIIPQIPIPLFKFSIHLNNPLNTHIHIKQLHNDQLTPRSTLRRRKGTILEPPHAGTCLHSIPIQPR